MSTTSTRAGEALHVPDPRMRIGPRSALVLVLVSVVGLMMLGWPLILDAPADGARVDPPFLFVALLPLLLVMVLAEMTEGGMDARTLALLGLLSAINGVLRGLGAGVAGVELIFFLMVLAGRVFGPAFGFVLGCTSLFVSALFTAGIGPWLPFQMLVAGWVGMGAGLLPRRPRGRAEVAMLVVYGVLAAYAYGLLMNLWGWPLALGIEVPGYEATELSFVSGAPLLENLKRFGLYTLVTSTGGWDTGRAVTNGLMIALVGPAVLSTLRRAARRAVVQRVPAS
ncbi:ECF transporter S component [Nocardioides daphniae]|uniref:ABC transporter permease n=2 Tax=Nocardioides daphniae TaxID=402297 RepID=A0ABQ1Q736_9ACTN|nr:ECF transporter S component [Nocardioides daphniae]GGD17060.1 ABC transporter permease [Nocardioides daphniae]